MTSEHYAFLNAIVAQPEDDLPRLVFADYLEESGEPALVARAHFIRAQIEADTLPVGHPERRALQLRATELKKSFRDEMDNLELSVPRTYYPAEYSRGFPNRIVTEWYTCLLLGQSYLSRIVALESLLVIGIQFVDRLYPMLTVEDPKLFLVSNAVHHYEPTDWPRFPTLRFLRLSAIAADDILTVFSVLIRVVQMPILKHLVIENSQLTDESMIWMLSHWRESSFWRSLQTLTLSSLPITDYSANTLYSAGGLDQLKLIMISGTRITEAGHALLVQRFGERLRFSYEPPGDYFMD